MVDAILAQTHDFCYIEYITCETARGIGHAWGVAIVLMVILIAVDPEPTFIPIACTVRLQVRTFVRQWLLRGSVVGVP